MLVKRIWLDTVEGTIADPGLSEIDVMVEMEDGEVWTAHFVTIPYLEQQLEVGAVATGSAKTGFVALETPHVIVREIQQDIIEDIVYELVGQGMFESVFDLVMDTPVSEEEVEE